MKFSQTEGIQKFCDVALLLLDLLEVPLCLLRGQHRQGSQGAFLRRAGAPGPRGSLGTEASYRTTAWCLAGWWRRWHSPQALRCEGGQFGARAYFTAQPTYRMPVAWSRSIVLSTTVSWRWPQPRRVSAAENTPDSECTCFYDLMTDLMIYPIIAFTKTSRW